MVGVGGTWRVPAGCRGGIRECRVRFGILVEWVECEMGMGSSDSLPHEPISAEAEVVP